MKRSTARQNVQRYRDRMRRAGFRLVQLWLPDTRSPHFAAECRRQSLAAGRRKRAEADVMRWVEAAADRDGWTP